MEKILIISDEKRTKDLLSLLLEGEGYEAISLCDSYEEGIDLLKKEEFDIVILDINVPGVEFEVLKTIKKISQDTFVIMITAFGKTETAIEAMRLGAYDYIHKPFKIDEIRFTVKKAIEKKRLSKEFSLLREKVEILYRLENIIGQSPKMQELFKLIPRIAQSKSNVLITGESGSGKEIVAQAIHKLSSHADKNFIAVHCADEILEIKLFGYMKGAFTGAKNDKQGLFEIANGNNIFIDEIAEMPFSLQPKLLCVIDNGICRRVGGVDDIKVNVRIISATNKNLKHLIDNGLFREDLFYRLNAIPIQIPPLRERKEDIPLLVNNFLNKYSGGTKKITKETLNGLMEYEWKGNVRELENVIERIVLFTDGKEITPAVLPALITEYKSEVKDTLELPEEGIEIDKVISNIEKNYLLKALERTGGVKTEAAKLLNLSFRSFRHRLYKYRIS